jgi:hypothetical protein
VHRALKLVERARTMGLVPVMEELK